MFFFSVFWNQCIGLYVFSGPLQGIDRTYDFCPSRLIIIIIIYTLAWNFELTRSKLDRVAVFPLQSLTAHIVFRTIHYNSQHRKFNANLITKLFFHTDLMICDLLTSFNGTIVVLFYIIYYCQYIFSIESHLTQYLTISWLNVWR